MKSRRTSTGRRSVLHLTAWLPDDANDSTGIFVREHIRAASTVSDGALIHVKWADPGVRAFAIEDVVGEPLPTVRLRIAHGPLGPLWLLLGVIQAMIYLPEVRRPDIIHSHTLRTTVPAAILSRLFRRPMVVTEHWTALLPGAEVLSARELGMARRAYRRAAVVLPVGPALAEAILELAPGSTVEVVENAVDDRLFHCRNAPPSVEHARFILVGSLIPRKRFDLALHAAALLQARRPDVCVDVVGDGPEAQALVALAGTLGIGPVCTFHGSLSKAAIADLMRSSSALLVTSEAETFSVVAAEALCCGTPVIVSRCGGPEHFVDESSGIVVDPIDDQTLAQAMSLALDAPWDSRRISSRAAAKFGFTAVGERFAAVYDSVSSS